MKIIPCERASKKNKILRNKFRKISMSYIKNDKHLKNLKKTQINGKTSFFAGSGIGSLNIKAEKLPKLVSEFSAIL